MSGEGYIANLSFNDHFVLRFADLAGGGIDGDGAGAAGVIHGHIIFGICLGHQLLALAMGCKTEKLKYGHRGVNQPVKDLQTGRTYISSQNHGYAVVNDTIEASGGTLRWVNANDGTCEGIDYPAQNAFTVQFHPEACSGPHDTRFLFDRFLQMMGGESHAAE